MQPNEIEQKIEDIMYNPSIDWVLPLDGSITYKKTWQLYGVIKQALIDTHNNALEMAKGVLPEPAGIQEFHNDWDKSSYSPEMAHDSCREQSVANITKLKI